VELARPGPGLLLRDILAEAPDVLAVTRVIARVSPDVLLLTNVDHDLEGHAIAALAARLDRAGASFPHRFALPPNAGLATGRDMDGDGRAGTPRDAQGYGEFAGQGGMALLSRLPIDPGATRDFSAFLWRDLPDALLAAGGPPDGAHPDQRLSSVGHWDVALTLPDGRRMRLWAWHATPPVFDGPEDRNGRRNHDESAFWLRYLEGALPTLPSPIRSFFWATPILIRKTETGVPMPCAPFSRIRGSSTPRREAGAAQQPLPGMAG
jgi:hypothetical protein